MECSPRQQRPGGWPERLALVAGLSFLALLLLPVSLDNTGRTFHAWWDFGHVPAFTALSWASLTLSRKWWPDRMRLPWVWLGCLLAVPGVEFMQGFVGRSQDLSDLLYGGLGCVVGGLAFAGGLPEHPARHVARALAVLLAVGATAWPVRLWLEDRRIEQLFPVLSAFDSPLETTRWHIVGCDVRPGNGWDVTIRNDTNCAALVLGDVPRDWTTAEGLGVDIFLHGEEPSDLTIIVDDTAFFPDYNNRFQKTLPLKPGYNAVRIEGESLRRTNGGRPMNMSYIYGVGLYFNQQHAGRTVRLNKVFLLSGKS